MHRSAFLATILLVGCGSNISNVDREMGGKPDAEADAVDIGPPGGDASPDAPTPASGVCDQTDGTNVWSNFSFPGRSIDDLTRAHLRRCYTRSATTGPGVGYTCFAGAPTAQVFVRDGAMTVTCGTGTPSDFAEMTVVVLLP